jgi:predicted dehydrogenase
VQPAVEEPEAEVTAIAARDLERARRFAAKHKISTAYGSYTQLLADPNIDAIYLAVPNGLHGRWTKAALEASKHVLCEKPFTANAEEAVSVAEAAQRSGRVVMEAFHYRYHALTRRMLKIVNSGELGEITKMEAWLCFPLVPANNVRWDYELAGGTLMDAGCYTIHLLRTLAGAEPEVLSATAKTRRAAVDRLLKAELAFPGRLHGLDHGVDALQSRAGRRCAGARNPRHAGRAKSLRPSAGPSPRGSFGHPARGRTCTPGTVHLCRSAAGVHGRHPARRTRDHRTRRRSRQHDRDRRVLRGGWTSAART